MSSLRRIDMAVLQVGHNTFETLPAGTQVLTAVRLEDGHVALTMAVPVAADTAIEIHRSREFLVVQTGAILEAGKQRHIASTADGLHVFEVLS